MITRSTDHQKRQPLLASLKMSLNIRLQLVSLMQSRIMKPEDIVRVFLLDLMLLLMMTSSHHIKVNHESSGLILMLLRQ